MSDSVTKKELDGIERMATHPTILGVIDSYREAMEYVALLHNLIKQIFEDAPAGWVPNRDLILIGKNVNAYLKEFSPEPLLKPVVLCKSCGHELKEEDR